MDFQFLGKTYPANKYLPHNYINNDLRKIGSKYRFLYERRGESFSGLYGEVIREEIIDIKGNPIYQIQLRIEKTKNYSEAYYGVNDHIETAFSFSDRAVNEVRKANQVFNPTNIFPHKRNEQLRVMSDVSILLQSPEQDLADQITWLIAKHEAMHLVNQFTYGVEESYLKDSLRLRDGKPFWFVVDELSADLGVYQDIIKLSKTNPKQASDLLKLFFTFRQTSYAPRSFQVTDVAGYFLQMFSMLMALSAFEIGEKGNLIINFDQFEKNISELNQALHQAQSLMMNSFKSSIVKLHQNQLSLDSILTLNEKYQITLEEVYKKRARKEFPDDDEYLIETAAIKFAINDLASQNMSELRAAIIQPNRMAMNTVNRFIVEKLEVPSRLIQQIP
jgi:hypothetical protein